MKTERTLLERSGMMFAGAVVLMVAFVTAAPYLGYVPQGSESTLTLHLSVVQTILNVFLLVAGFFFGTSVGTLKKDTAIADQASTIQQAQSVLAPLVNGDQTITLAPGETATAKATATGTTITPDEEPK